MSGTGEIATGPRLSPKSTAFWSVMFVVLATDVASKRLAVQELSPGHLPHRVIGDYLRLTLAYNPDAAMGLSLGPFSRIGFTLTAIAVLGLLAVLYRRVAEDEWRPALALGLISGGALGNLADRVTSSLGVVDFIDIGLGGSRFWTFNVADACILCGAVLLAMLSANPSNPSNSATLPLELRTSSPDPEGASFATDRHHSHTAPRSVSRPGDTE